MTRLVIDLPDQGLHTAAAFVKFLRGSAERSGVPNGVAAKAYNRLADALQAAVNRPVIVLDADALGLDAEDAGWLRHFAKPHEVVLQRVLRAVADAIGPPEPEEPGVVGTVVNDRNKDPWVRVLHPETPWHFESHAWTWDYRPPNEAVENLRYVAREYDDRMRQEGYIGDKPPSNARLLLRLVNQIEQQTRDPKPAEPRAFGARVTARAGGGERRRFLRFRTDRATGWISEDQDPVALPWTWSDLSDVTLGWDDESGDT